MKTINKSELKRVRAPKGFRFEIVKPGSKKIYSCLDSYAYCHLINKNIKNKRLAKVGTISLEPYSNNEFMTHAQLKRKYRNKGLGTKLYAAAIQWCLDNGYKVTSSFGPSEMAQRVWSGSSLRKWFEIRKPMQGSYLPWVVVKQKKKAVKTTARKKSRVKKSK